MQHIPLQEATEKLPLLVAAALRGDLVFITTEDQHVVRLVAAKQSTQPRTFGSANGSIQMDDDFDAPLEDFHEYTV